MHNTENKDIQQYCVSAFGQIDYEYLLEFPIEVIFFKLLYAKKNSNNLRAQLKNIFLREYTKW